MKTLKPLALSIALVGSIGSASAATIANLDGTFDFGGFDWSSSGAVRISSYDIVRGGVGRTGQTDTFTLDYFAFATEVQDSTGAEIPLAGLRVGTGSGYEYTIAASITEQITCLNGDCSLVQIDVLTGSWNIFYDTTGDALAGAAGMVGFLDGTSILSGSFDPIVSDSLLGVQGPSNPGNVTLAGTFRGGVTSTNLTYVNPALTGTEAVSTLQFGLNATNWVRPTTWDGAPLGPNTNTTFVGQADANQAFSVPEPGSLALMGLGLGAGALMRRRQSRS